jgi:hypothetical protein
MTTFTGTSGNDILPLAGADNSGADILYGLAGNDRLYGGSGNDVLVGGIGTDIFYGGTGTDEVSYVGSAGRVDVNLGAGIAHGVDAGPTGEQLFEVENLTGSIYNDALYGNTVSAACRFGSAATRRSPSPSSMSCWKLRVSATPSACQPTRCCRSGSVTC